MNLVEVAFVRVCQSVEGAFIFQMICSVYVDNHFFVLGDCEVIVNPPLARASSRSCRSSLYLTFLISKTLSSDGLSNGLRNNTRILLAGSKTTACFNNFSAFRFLSISITTHGLFMMGTTPFSSTLINFFTAKIINLLDS